MVSKSTVRCFAVARTPEYSGREMLKMQLIERNVAVSDFTRVNLDMLEAL